MSDYTYEFIKENDRLPVRFGLAQTAPCTFAAHWHKYLEILCLLSGKMSAVIQAEHYELAVGDIIVINSGDIHMTQTWGEKTEYVLLQISEEQLSVFLPNFHLLRFQTRISEVSRIELKDERVGAGAGGYMGELEEKSKGEKEQNAAGTPLGILKEMLGIYERQKDGYPLQFMAKLYELLYQLYHEHAQWQTLGIQSSEQRNFARMTQIIDWVQSHYRESIKLEAAAAHLGFSREYFCRMFKKYTGQTFLEYVNGVRAMKLYEEMKDSDESLTILMEKHGITNYKVFLHTFRKLYGDTPQKVRNRERVDRLEDALLERT